MDTLKPYDTYTVRLPHFSEVSRDPQTWENDFIREVTYPTGYTHRVPTSPIEMEDVEICPLDTTKAVGEYAAKVLSELGYTDAQMQGSGEVRRKEKQVRAGFCARPLNSDKQEFSGEEL